MSEPGVPATVSAVPPIAAGVDFLQEPVAVFGLLLMAGALVAGLARRSVLSLTAAFVVAGFILGQGGLEVLDIDPTSDFAQALAVIALVLILFRDGALLSPTDPVLSSSVVTNPRMPRLIRLSAPRTSSRSSSSASSSCSGRS